MSRGRLTIITGEAGTGKTTTADDLRERNQHWGLGTVIIEEGPVRQSEIADHLARGCDVVIVFGGNIGNVSVINMNRGAC